MSHPFSELLQHLPPVLYAVGYGSGVVQQTGYTTGSALIDLLLIIPDDEITSWHQLNQSHYHHSYHYSSIMKWCSDGMMRHIHEYGAGIYYNTDVPVGSFPHVKYGVLTKSALLTDLCDWKYLYAAGRLHKPTVTLTPPLTDPTLTSALETNLLCAVYTALLLLPERFTEEELYRMITQLSYMGDIRMSIGENPNKIRNIVTAQLPLFRDMYTPIIDRIRQQHVEISEEITTTSLTSPTRVYHQSMSHGQRRWMVMEGLPNEVRRRAQIHTYRHDDATLLPSIRSSIASIVRDSSRQQTLKGILTAGPMKSAIYATAKMMKRWKK